jgi:hypothetical protein
LDLTGAVVALLAYLQGGCPAAVSTGKLLNLVLVDSKVRYPGGRLDKKALARLGVTVVDAPLVRPEAPDVYDPGLLAELLLSLV